MMDAERDPFRKSAPSANAAQFEAARDDVFARIARRYDTMCDLFSFGVHRLWKTHLARRMARECEGVVLDAASGTGDIPVRILTQLARAGRADAVTRFHVLDLSAQMLAIARPKLADAPCVRIAVEDVHDLAGIDDNSVDAFSISFAMKIVDRRRAARQALRVLRPGGAFYCLEASRIPFAPLQYIYLSYMRVCIPLIGRIAASGDKSAYDYLLRGLSTFPDRRAYAAELEASGFVDVHSESLSFGVVALHTARKPRQDTGVQCASARRPVQKRPQRRQ